MTAEQYLAGLYAVRRENIIRLIEARQMTFSEFSLAIGRAFSFASLLVQHHRTPTEQTMRAIEHTFGYEFDSMDREDFEP